MARDNQKSRFNILYYSISHPVVRKSVIDGPRSRFHFQFILFFTQKRLKKKIQCTKKIIFKSTIYEHIMTYLCENDFLVNS